MSLNVLVVDDSAVMRAMIIKTLKMAGVPIGQIYEAGNGQEGLRAINDNWIDLALVDINMPVMDGEQMIDEVRATAETADLPVVVVSTETSETRIEALQKKGASFVHKPFTPEALRQTVIAITGVSNDYASGDGALQDSGYDF